MLDAAFFLAALRLTTPLALSALGGVLTERSGVIALHLEAVLLAGAFASVAASGSGNVVLGLLAGAFAGAVVGLLHGVLTLAFRVPHILSGVALNLGAVGLTTYALRQSNGGMETTARLSPWLMTGLVVVATLACWWWLFRTAGGLRLRACGENPAAARASGVAVSRYRYGALAVGGALAGLGGVALTLTGLGAFTENMAAGRGYMALAAVIFGRWNPIGATLTALLFGAGDALQLSLQTAGLARYVPADLLALFPYILTLVALAGFSGKGNAPAALGAEESG